MHPCSVLGMDIFLFIRFNDLITEKEVNLKWGGECGENELYSYRAKHNAEQYWRNAYGVSFLHSEQHLRRRCLSAIWRSVCLWRKNIDLYYKSFGDSLENYKGTKKLLTWGSQCKIRWLPFIRTELDDYFIFYSQNRLVVKQFWRSILHFKWKRWKK